MINLEIFAIAFGLLGTTFWIVGTVMLIWTRRCAHDPAQFDEIIDMNNLPWRFRR